MPFSTTSRATQTFLRASSVNELANVSWPDLFLASSQAGGSGGGRFSVPKWGQRQLAESQRARGGQSQAEARGHADAKRGALDAWCCCPVPRSSQLLHGKRVCFMLGFALTCRLSATIRDLPWDAAGTFDRWRVCVACFQVSYLCRCACLHRADRRADSCRQLQTEAKPQKLWVGVWSCVIKACKMLFYVVFTPFTAHPKNPNHTPALVASFHQRLRWGLQTAAQAAGPVVR